MPHKDEIEYLLGQIEDLLRMAQEKTTEELEGELPSGIEEKIQKLERDMEKFHEMNRNARIQKNLPESHLQELKEDLEKVHPRDRYLIEYAGQIIKKIEKAKKNLETVIEETRSTRDIAPKKAKEGPRKRKFKRVGGQKNWKPL